MEAKLAKRLSEVLSAVIKVFLFCQKCIGIIVKNRETIIAASTMLWVVFGVIKPLTQKMYILN